MGIERVEPEYFDTPATIEAFKKPQRSNSQQNDQGGRGREPAILADETGWYYGTVGCVALDNFGNLAAATSTGGVPNKQYGRVGDSPIVGAGTYADNATCAVSCTGIGEQFIRNAVAYDVSAQIAYRNMTVEQSVGEIIKHKLKQGDGGIIAVSRDGSITIQYNTPGMARAAADSNGRFEVVWIDQQQESATR
jgi:beta-aspartyl-peptidase (threonine type)